MNFHYQHLIPVLLLTLAALPACSDDGGETDGVSETTAGSSGSSGETTAAPPTTGDETVGAETTTGTGTGTDEPTGGDVESNPAIFASCKSALDDMERVAERECECDVMAGEYPDLATCLGGDPEAAGNYCPCDVYARHPESKASVDCLAEAADAHAGCAEAAVCSDDAFENCSIAFITMLLQCEQASPALEEDLEASCGIGDGGDGGFTCGSGEQVPGPFQCDGEPDCEDGSDESQCG